MGTGRLQRACSAEKARCRDEPESDCSRLFLSLDGDRGEAIYFGTWFQRVLHNSWLCWCWAGGNGRSFVSQQTGTIEKEKRQEIDATVKVCQRHTSSDQVLPARLCLPQFLLSPQTVLQQRHRPVFPVLRRLTQEDHEFEASFGLQVEVTLKKKKSGSKIVPPSRDQTFSL